MVEWIYAIFVANPEHDRKPSARRDELARQAIKQVVGSGRVRGRITDDIRKI